MGERVAVWKRVSTDMTRQDITSQEAEIAAWVAAHGYEVVRMFELEASAYKGQHDAHLRATVEDVRRGQYCKVVMAMSSRIERRGWKVLLRYLLELDELGARVEATDDPTFGQLDDDNPLTAAMTMLTGHNDHQYSKKISDNVNRENRRIDAGGYFRGAPPAGYEVTGEKRRKVLVPAADRRDVQRQRGPRGKKVTVTLTLPSAADVVQAFKDCASGTPTTALARRIGMTPDSVRAVIRNRTYSTGTYEIKRHDGVTHAYRCPPLVTPALQAAAIAAMEARRAGDNVSSRAIKKEDFSGALYCPCGAADARMYRYTSGTGRARKDGTMSPKATRYRCVTCHKSVLAPAADAAVNRIMLADTSPWITLVHVPGNTVSADLERVRLELLELPGRGLAEDAEDAERSRLRAQRRRLEAMPATPDRWEPGFTRREDGSIVTEADHWAAMTTPERRAHLLGPAFSVIVAAAPGRKGEVLAEVEHYDLSQAEAA